MQPLEDGGARGVEETVGVDVSRSALISESPIGGVGGANLRVGGGARALARARALRGSRLGAQVVGCGRLGFLQERMAARIGAHAGLGLEATRKRQQEHSDPQQALAIDEEQDVLDDAVRDARAGRDATGAVVRQDCTAPEAKDVLAHGDDARDELEAFEGEDVPRDLSE